MSRSSMIMESLNSLVEWKSLSIGEIKGGEKCRFKDKEKFKGAEGLVMKIDGGKVFVDINGIKTTAEPSEIEVA